MAYGEDVRLVIQLFQERLAATSPVYAWRSGRLDRTGFLDTEQTMGYALHGAGCTVEFNERKLVSFDWDETGNYSFDAWKFKLYTDSIGVNCDVLEDQYVRTLAQSYFYCR
ncbi:DUF6896 domain-containing protein [Hymenobacter profundi]|uniref:DUF6896 domain-containing protein n=1 Tax=Hymenobacter profundi TaxID=1982110 RepID=UPI001C58EB4C|nr:hypothetical protein [Hymenobacter profundi]